MSTNAQDRNNTFSISPYMAVASPLLSVAVAVPLYFWSKLAVYVVALSFFGLEVSALTPALLERRRKPSKVALIVAPVGIVLPGAAVRVTGTNVADPQSAMVGPLRVFPSIVIVLMAVHLYQGIFAI